MFVLADMLMPQSTVDLDFSLQLNKTITISRRKKVGWCDDTRRNKSQKDTIKSHVIFTFSYLLSSS